MRSRLWLDFDGQGLTHVDWCDAGAGAPERAEPRVERPLPSALEGLARYLAGAPGVDPARLPVVLQGTAFQRRVWTALRAIPVGRVRSYAGVAKDVEAPRAMRAVGQANRRNPLPVVVPCHRVVQAGYRLGGYSGGLERKRFLLHLEGVTFEGERVHPGQLTLP